MAGNLKGRLLNNRYLIGERIGFGGMAEVYQGQDNVLGRTVAVKVMLPQYAEDPSFTTRFRQEAAAAANLQSPYIVNVYDWGQDDGTSFIVMEYVRGSDLKTAIKQRGAINQRKVAEIASQVCQALSVAHNLDIVHRDIKPQNIMVQPDGNVKVMDFGIARAKNSVMEKTSAVLGTAHYISPEQAQGKELTSASDIYSLGVVMYEAVTGQLPFDGPDAVSVALMQVNDMPTPPHEVFPDIDPALEAIIMKAMSKNPHDRFATARDMRHVLNDYLAGRNVVIGGFNSAPTALMTDAISDGNGRLFQTDQTSVMVPAISDVPPQGGVTHQGGYVAPVQQGTKKKGRKGLVVFGVLVAIAAIAALLWVLVGHGLSSPATPKGVEVPDVANKTLSEATTIISDAGLVVGDDIQYVFSDDVKADVVMGQTPRAGATLDEGGTVELTVSKGIEQVTVPDLSNMNANDARAALKDAGLKYEAGAAEYSDSVKENRVLRQEPEAGAVVDKNSTVTYFLSAGVEKISIPNVVGDYEDTAQSTLENAGFKVKVEYESDDEVEQGRVIRQSPSANEKAKEGTTVNLVVSTGPQYYNVSVGVNDEEGGSAYVDYDQVEAGGSATFTIEANKGYVISAVYDSNGNSYGATSYVTISEIYGDVSLYVEFEKDSSADEGESKDESKDENKDTESNTSASGDKTGQSDTSADDSTNNGTSGDSTIDDTTGDETVDDSQTGASEDPEVDTVAQDSY